jgi:uncharacterized membrane protein YphA (DoxX/SURF4 family)
MNAASCARIASGLAAIFYGVMCLIWRDADAWESIYNLWSMPLGAAIGICAMIVLVCAGAGVLFPRTARASSIALVAVYVIFTLAYVPDIVAAPLTYGPYVGFFNIFSLVFGALALDAFPGPRAGGAGRIGVIARIGFGICIASFALAQVVFPKITADLVPAWIPPSQMFWVWLTTFAFGLAAIAVLIDRAALPALRLLSIMLALFGVVVWVPIIAAKPGAHFNWAECALTLLIAAAAWSVAERKAR